MNAKRNSKGAITAIMHQNTKAEIALLYSNLVITAARTVNKGIFNLEAIETLERLKILTVPHIWYMGKGTKGLPKMREEFEPENEGIVIPTQGWLLLNPCTIRERR